MAALLAGLLALGLTPARSAELATADDTARFLAGLPPRSDSPLAALNNDASWLQHTRVFNAIFEREDQVTLSKVRAFAAAHLTSPHDTMFYMFSGPDFLYATSFFPQASTYVLAGLEPVGNIPQLTTLSRGTVDQTLHNLESSLSTILNLSFFRTKDMQTQLNEGPVFGTLPVLYVFLARTGKTIREASFVSLDAAGNFIAPSDTSATGGGKPNAESITQGVRIVFSDGDGRMHTLFYFSTNLANDGVRRSGFLAFCEKLGPADSFLKSASYLMFSGNFAKVRSFLLDHSATVLQDDSGIPLAYFESKGWRLQPFGHYLGPISIFPRAYQPAMAALFRDAAPLDFGIGYRWRRNESNLLLAERGAPQVGAVAVNAPLTNTADATMQIPVGSDNAPAWAKLHPRHVETISRLPPQPPPPPPIRGFLGFFGFRDY